MTQEEIVLRIAGEEEARAVGVPAPHKHHETVLALKNGEVVACTQVHVATNFRDLKKVCRLRRPPGDYVPALILEPLNDRNGKAVQAIRYVLTDWADCGEFVSAILELTEWSSVHSRYEKIRIMKKEGLDSIPVLHSAEFKSVAAHLKGDLQVKWEGPLPFPQLFDVPLIKREWMR